MRLGPLAGVGMLLTVTLAGAMGSAGCEGVPDLRFVADDARSDAPAGDGGPSTDASDGSARDAGACSSPSPGAGATCCGSVWCLGQCDQVSCDQCAQKARSGVCAPGDICCGKTGTVLCKKQCP